MIPYRKLSRKRRTLGGSTQLWLGDDHVLLVKGTHFTEEYRRFQLEDIQAIAASQATRSPKGAVLGLLGLLAFGMIAATNSPYARAFWAVLGALGVGALIYDLLRGMRVRCKLLTEVSTEVLAPITRLSDYHRLLQTLGPAIETAQGKLAAEAAASFTGPAFVKPAEEPLGAMRYLPHTFYACIAINVLALAGFHLWRKEEFLQIAGTLVFGEAVLCVLLWIRAKRLKLEGSLKGLFALATILLALDVAGIAGQASYFVYSIAEAGRQGQKPPVFWDLPWIPAIGKASVIWRAAVAPLAFGLLWLSKPKIVVIPENPPSQE